MGPQPIDTTCALLPPAEVGLLHVTGADRAKYLQSMLTNDVRLREPGQGCQAWALTVKGKLVAPCRALVRNEAIQLVTPAPDELSAHLKRFIVINKVEIAVRPLRELGLEGPAAASVLAAATGDPAAALEPLAHAQVTIAGQPVTVQRFSEVASDGRRVLVDPAAANPVAAALLQAVEADGGAVLGPEGWDALRIEAGVPTWEHELQEPGLLPKHLGLDAALVDYKKGCYLGQEPVAMLHFRGKLTRALRVLFYDWGGSGPEAGSSVYADDKEVGHVTRCARSLREPERGVALAILKGDAMEPGSRVQFGVQGGPTARVYALPGG